MPSATLRTLVYPTLSRLPSLLPPSPVLVFVGGTSGIGLSTLRALLTHAPTLTPRVYLIGRSSTAASQITSDFQILNPNATITFLQSDVSLLKNVDDVCATIREKEDKVNLLFMTCGFFTINSARQDTSEGLDRKLALHYYARARFIQNLASLLSAASKIQSPTHSRVISILDSRMGLNASPNFSDLALEESGAYGLASAAAHACAMNTWSMERWAKTLPGTTFIHGFPGTVRTGVGRELGTLGNAMFGFMGTLLKPLFVDLKESGNGWAFASVSGRYPSKEAGAAGESGKEEVEVAIASDGVTGSGAYAVDWNGVRVFGEKGRFPNAERLRGEGAAEKVWTHTEEIFAKVCGVCSK